MTISKWGAENYFASAASCPNITRLEDISDCDTVSCGQYCSASKTLPDGNSDYAIGNCLIDEHKYNIFVRICAGLAPPSIAPTLAPTIAQDPTLSPTVKPTAHSHVVLGCVEGDTNITTQTIQTISTCAKVGDATVECLAACQVSDIYEYWISDAQKQMCNLKESNGTTVPREIAISDAQLCNTCTNH